MFISLLSQTTLGQFTDPKLKTHKLTANDLIYDRMNTLYDNWKLISYTKSSFILALVAKSVIK